MSKLLPFFRWYPADAESDADYAALSLEELGLFHRCLNLAWANDGLPTDPERLRESLRLSKSKFDRAWSQVSKFFHGTDRLRNSRQELERNHAREKREKASESISSRWKSVKELAPEKVVERNTNVSEFGYERITTDAPSVLPRAIARAESESVSCFGSGFKGGAGGIGPDELEAAWERHKKHVRGEPFNLVASMVANMNGQFDAAKFRDRHPRYCDYWDSAGWQFSSLTFLGWIEARMPEPPKPAKSAAEIEMERIWAEV